MCVECVLWVCIRIMVNVLKYISLYEDTMGNIEKYLSIRVRLLTYKTNALKCAFKYTYKYKYKYMWTHVSIIMNFVIQLNCCYCLNYCLQPFIENQRTKTGFVKRHENADT